MSITYIGCTLSAVASTPAGESVSQYAALSFTEIGKIISIGEVGDTSEDVTFDLLKAGRRTHVNGVKDLGEIPVEIEYDSTDTGQALMSSNSNSNTTLSFVITDPDGHDIYFQGKVANFRSNARNASAYKGCSFALRGTTGTTEGDTYT